MIPKKLHTIRLGGSAYPPLMETCLTSWKKYCPSYDIHIWTEKDLDLSHAYITKALEAKKRAFASDVARLHVLQQHGGIYLDTDMELLKSLDAYCEEEFFIGKEDEEWISAGIIGCVPDHPFISSVLEVYKTQQEFVEIPKILTQTYASYDGPPLKIAEPQIFYPLPARTRFRSNMITSGSVGIHRRDDSRNTGSARLLKKWIPKSLIIQTGKFLDLFGIKDFLKKILNI